jgi:hypothetical protein
LRPNKIYRNDPKIDSKEIKVVSPTTEDGGVELAVGMNYRIFAVNMDGRFFIWNGTVLRL